MNLVANFLIYALCSILLSVSIYGYAEANDPANIETLKVYVIAGQSNAGAQGYVSEMPPIDSSVFDPSSVLLSVQARNSGCNPNASSEFQPMDYTDKNRFGVEFSMAKHLASRRPNSKFAIIKVFESNSNLDNHWNPNAEHTGNTCDRNFPESYSPMLYSELISNVLSKLSDLGGGADVSLEGVIWIQGESDVTMDFAPKYMENLKSLVDNLRSDLRPTELEHKKLKIYITELSSTPHYPSRRPIRESQWRLAQNDHTQVSDHDINVEMIHTSDLTFLNEGDLNDRLSDVHYDSQSNLTLGVRIADRIVMSESQRPENRERAELVQYYSATNTDHWATTVLPLNEPGDPIYTYHRKLGRLYKYNSTSGNRVLLVGCVSGSGENTNHRVRRSHCWTDPEQVDEPETKIRNLGYINTEDDPVGSPDNRQPLYVCFAEGLNSSLLGLEWKCGHENHSQSFKLGYIERNN